MTTEYGGDDPSLPSTVESLGPEGGRELTTADQLRLGYLTGRIDDPAAPLKPEVFRGFDRDNPWPER